MRTLSRTNTILTGEVFNSMAEYKAAGGCLGLDQALEMTPEQVLRVVDDSGLRGRGGAGFPTARKWRGTLESEGERRFVVANGAEGEPGTFKDRYLMRRNPYQVIEGLLIAVHTLGAERAYIGVKESFQRETDGLTRALTEFRGTYELAARTEIILGPDEYLFGEEKALLEVIEGGLPLPRVFPPYIHGLFAGAYGGAVTNPTAVNNVETLANVPLIIRNGASWFRRLGTQDSPGTMIFTVSGDVQTPGVEELALGLTLRQLLFEVAGGPRQGHDFKAIFPGLAGGLMTPAAIDLSLSFDSVRAAGASLGSAGFVVYDDSACMARVAYLFSRFLHVESCNQCAACKLGSRLITDSLERLLSGSGDPDDISAMREACGMVENGQRCFLPTSERSVVTAILDVFPEDFTHHLAPQTCDLNHDFDLPKIVDYSEESGFTLDKLYSYKQPDWTYDLPGSSGTV
jgi:NADH-quinone oxidoreductase subunit F